MIYTPGQAYYGEFITRNPTTGAAADADSLPVATATKNGVDDAAFVLTVAKIDTGRYKVTGTVPAGYAAGSWVHISVSAIMGGITAKAVIEKLFVDIIFSGHAGTVSNTGRPGTAYYGMFITSSGSTGAATDADILPVATATKNGVDDAVFALTVAKIDTGRYKVTGTIPAGYAVYDRVQIFAAATVGGVDGKDVIERLMIDSGAIDSADPKRQQILDAIKARLQTILIANGYKTDMGSHVVEWDTAPLDPNLETIQIEYRDESGTTGYEAVGEHLHTLPVTFRIRVKSNSAALSTVRNACADLYHAINLDVTFGGLAHDTNQEGQITEQFGQAADAAAGVEVKYLVEYTTEPGNPYQ